MNFLQRLKEFFFIDLFESVGDSIGYLLVYWLLPVITIVCQFVPSIDYNSPESILGNISYFFTLFVMAVGSLYDCYNRWHNSFFSDRLKIILMGFLNFILFSYSLLMILTIGSQKTFEFKWVILFYCFVLTAMVIPEVAKVIFSENNRIRSVR